VISLSQLHALLEDWNWKPGSLRSNEAAEAVRELMPDIVEELRSSRLILERSKPRIGW